MRLVGHISNPEFGFSVQKIVSAATSYGRRELTDTIYNANRALLSENDVFQVDVLPWTDGTVLNLDRCEPVACMID